MAKLTLLGPVFVAEAVTAARRWQVYAVRSLAVTALLAALLFVGAVEAARPYASINQRQVRISRGLYVAVVGTQLVLVLLAAPAATAGAVCLDKGRGTLDHLLVTDLSDAEIVLGKLAARLAPVLGLVAGALPVLALSALQGGVDPVSLAGAFAVTLGVAVFGGSLALALSVWGSRMHEVLLVSYAIGAAWVALGPTWFLMRWLGGTPLGPPGWLLHANPFWLAFAPFNPFVRSSSVDPGACLTFLGGCLAVSAVVITAAVMRVREVAARQGGREGGRALQASGLWRWFRRLPGPTLDGNPVLWREWHRRGPARWSRVVWLLYTVMAAVIAVLVVAFGGSGPARLRVFAAMLNGGQVAVGLLLLSAGAATALAEERAGGSLELLLSTPLSTRSIVWGKWWGGFRSALLLAVPPAFAAAVLAGPHGRWAGVPLAAGLTLAYGAALTSLGLALATWVSRLGRAVALTAGAYVVVTAGWFFLVIVATRNTPGPLGPGLASGSPPIGVLFVSLGILDPSTEPWHAALGWGSFWAAVYAFGSASLLAATLATFDRCLQRGAPAPPHRGGAVMEGTGVMGQLAQGQRSPCRS
jgi:ABC-type transport system involved in multi-copper enzyme maturation permease subunit